MFKITAPAGNVQGSKLYIQLDLTFWAEPVQRSVMMVYDISMFNNVMGVCELLWQRVLVHDSDWCLCKPLSIMRSSNSNGLRTDSLCEDMWKLITVIIIII